MEAPKLYPESPTVEVAYSGKLLGLTPIQHVAVRYLAGGWPMGKIAEELKIPRSIIKRWKEDDPTFREAYAQQVVSHTEMVETILLEGERRAAAALVEALDATTRDGKPAWQTRVMAATTLLDRAGNRGKAVEKQQVASVTAHVSANTPGVEDALKKALRDPGVRMWLKESGAVVGLIGAAPEEVDAEVIEIHDGFDTAGTPITNPIDSLEESA